MKLQKIIDSFNKDGLLASITIDVRSRYTVCSISKKHHKSPILKVYKSFTISDYNIKEVSNDNVKHLGVERYFYHQNENLYINLYYYNN